MREEIEGALDGLQLVFGRSVRLKLEQSHLESKPEIDRPGRGNRPEHVVKSLLFATRTLSIAEVKVVANGIARKVDVPDAKSAVGDRRSNEIFVALVRLWLRHIADRREVEFPWAPRCVLNNAEFSRRIGGGTVELELIRWADEARKETGERQRTLIRKQALDRRTVRLQFENPLGHEGCRCGRLACGNGWLHSELTSHDALSRKLKYPEAFGQVESGVSGR